MTRLDVRAEPSMEDILASIRKIIAEDGSQAPLLKPRLPADNANQHHAQDGKHSTNGLASAQDSATASHGLTGRTSSEAEKDDSSALPSSGDHRLTTEASDQHSQALADQGETSANSYTRVPGPERPGFTVMRDGFLPEHGDSAPSAEDAFASELGARSGDNAEDPAKPAGSTGFSFDLGPSPFAKKPDKDKETTTVTADNQTSEESSQEAERTSSDDLDGSIDDTIEDAFGSENSALNTHADDTHDVETTLPTFESDQQEEEHASDRDETFDSGDDRSESGDDYSRADSVFGGRPQAEPETGFDQPRASSEPDVSTARSPDRPMFGFPSGNSDPFKRTGGFGASQMRGSENRNNEEEASYTPIRSATRDVLNVAEPEPAHGRTDRTTSSYADAVTEHLASIGDKAAPSSTANLFDRKSESEGAQSNAGIGNAFEVVATTLDDGDNERSKNALTVSDPDTRAIEDTVADLLRPMLKSWLAENMPKIVERALRREINELKFGASPDERDDD